MKLRRLDDYQSWALESDGKRLLIDPWLTDEWSLSPGHWLFGRRRLAPDSVQTYLPIDALFLTAHFSDHLHPKTLSQIPKSVPTFAPATAAKVLRKMGFTHVTVLADGHRVNPWPGLEVECVASGFPFRHNALGYVFAAKNSRVYLEPHLVNLKRASRIGAIDVLVAPVQSVRLLGLPFSMSASRATHTAQILKPKKWVPTGNEPQLGRGLFSTLMLFYQGSISDFRDCLAQAKLGTELIDAKSTDVIELRS